MRSILIISTVVAAGLCGCTASTTSGQPSTTTSKSSGTSVTSSATHSPAPPHTTSTPPPGPRTAAAVFASMSEAERVGQLVMMDNPSTSVSQLTLHDIRTLHVGAVILDGNSYLSASAISNLTARLQAAAGPVKLFVSTDQEGGLVRRMRGPGFSAMPSALVQGAEPVSSLSSAAVGWAKQLSAAGINVDLAPVLDTVPSNSPGNPPIGDLDREYGHDTATVASHGVAVAQALGDGGVDATIKHFPGLGRVTGNTDTTSGVTDTVTTATDGYLQPFAAAINQGVPFVMMSTAIYSRIDPGVPAAFSSVIIGGLLRGQLGFQGIVISDDLGAAKQVSGYSVANRAVDFVNAGGDIVLTVDASKVATMVAALLQRANSDSTFKAKVDAAALLVLQEKQRLGLLG